MKPFNFKEAVADAKADYPVETKNITFVDLSAPFARLRLWWWLNNMSDEFYPLMTNNSYYSLWEIAQAIIDKVAIAVKDPFTGKGLMAMRPDASGNWAFEKPHFVFNHELGHLVVPGGAPDAQSLLARSDKDIDKWDMQAEIEAVETPADVFAALRCIAKRYMSPAEASDIARHRAIDTWEKEERAYNTTLAIDQVIAYVGKTTLPLTAQEIKLISQDHAKKFTLTAPEIVKMSVAIDVPETTGLIDVLTQSPASTAPAHIAAHVLAAFVEQESLRKVFQTQAERISIGELQHKLTQHLKITGLDKVIPLRT